MLIDHYCYNVLNKFVEKHKYRLIIFLLNKSTTESGLVWTVSSYTESVLTLSTVGS